MAEEAEQGGFDLVRVGPGDGVRAALHDDELHIRDEAGQSLAGLVERQDPVGVTLNDQYRGVDLRQVGTKVSLPVVTEATVAMADIVTATLKLAQ